MKLLKSIRLLTIFGMGLCLSAFHIEIIKQPSGEVLGTIPVDENTPASEYAQPALEKVLETCPKDPPPYIGQICESSKYKLVVDIIFLDEMRDLLTPDMSITCVRSRLQMLALPMFGKDPRLCMVCFYGEQLDKINIYMGDEEWLNLNELLINRKQTSQWPFDLDLLLCSDMITAPISFYTENICIQHKVGDEMRTYFMKPDKDRSHTAHDYVSDPHTKLPYFFKSKKEGDKLMQDLGQSNSEKFYCSTEQMLINVRKLVQSGYKGIIAQTDLDRQTQQAWVLTSNPGISVPDYSNLPLHPALINSQQA